MQLINAAFRAQKLGETNSAKFIIIVVSTVIVIIIIITNNLVLVLALVSVLALSVILHGMDQDGISKPVLPNAHALLLQPWCDQCILPSDSLRASASTTMSVTCHANNHTQVIPRAGILSRFLK